MARTLSKNAASTENEATREPAMTTDLSALTGIDSKDSEREPGGIQVIARAAAILRSLGREGVSLGTLARKTGLPRSTVQRIVDALAADNFVEAGDAGVTLGWGHGRLAQIAHSDVVARVRPYLETLYQATDETVDIASRSTREVTFLDRIISQQELRVVTMVDKPRPLHAMANGKAILSVMQDDEVATLLEGHLSKLTNHTIDAVPALLKELGKIRRSGFAFDREEHAIGVCAVGVAIKVDGLAPHGISIAVPTSRFEENLPRFCDLLIKARDGMQAALRGMIHHATERG